MLNFGLFEKIARKFGTPVYVYSEKQIKEAHNRLKSISWEIFLKAAKALLVVAEDFSGLEYLDFGGGLGVPYRPEEKSLDVKRLGQEILKRFRSFCKSYGRRLNLILEPGRYLVAEAGYLLTRVNTVKNNPDGRIFVGVDTGFNHLIRPAMYGSYHEIVNISNPRGRKQKVDIVGNLCES